MRVGMAGRVQSDLAAMPLLVGRYQYLERLGEGGMGVVWRCYDRDLEELVAIKFLREELARDPGIRGLFRREVKLARRVTHVNVARVFEFRGDGGTCFLTMEYIDGPTLYDVLARGGPLTIAQARPLIVSLCRGLAVAHNVGVIHGDIKPNNILLDSARGAVLTDFGIARALTEAEFRLGVVGTPRYMAPELLAGGKGTLSSDVYAVGVMLHEMVTGTSPWDDPDATSIAAVRARALEPDLRRFASSLPAPWLELIRSCLHVDPARRPPNARVLTVALSTMNGAPESPPPPPRPPAPAEVQGPKWIEVLPFTIDDPNGSGGWVVGDIKDALAQMRGVRVAGPAPPETRPSSIAQVRGAVRQSEHGVVVHIDVLHECGASRTGFELHQTVEGLPCLGREIAAKISEAVDPEPRAATPAQPVSEAADALSPEVSSLYVRAREALLSMQPERALALYERALEWAPDHRLLRIGQIKARLMAMSVVGQPSPRDIEEARRLVESVVAANDDLGQAHLARAIIRLTLNASVGCAMSLRAALQRAPSLVLAHVMMADLLMEIGRLPDAERHLDIACRLDRNSAQVWASVAILRARQGRHEEFQAVVDAHLDPRARIAVLIRWTIGRAEQETLDLFERYSAVVTSGLSPRLVEICRELLTVQLRRDGHEAGFRRLEVAQADYVHTRVGGQFAQALCELACVLGMPERARHWLAVAEEFMFIDIQWLDHRPALAPLRADPMFAAIRENVLDRVDAVAEAIWG